MRSWLFAAPALAFALVAACAKDPARDEMGADGGVLGGTGTVVWSSG